MLTIETRVAPSAIHGIGLFAAQPVEQGTIVSYFSPPLDLRVKENPKFHSPIANTFVNEYGFQFDVPGSLIVFGDNARFINHAQKASLGYIRRMLIATNREYEHAFVALHPLPSGAELTLDYKLCCEFQYRRVKSFFEHREASIWPPKIPQD
jgi:uncharacterized protein